MLYGAAIYANMYYVLMEEVMKAIPTDRLCFKEDFDLWKKFEIVYQNLYNRTPDKDYWTEADVHQFLEKFT